MKYLVTHKLTDLTKEDLPAILELGCTRVETFNGEDYVLAELYTILKKYKIPPTDLKEDSFLDTLNKMQKTLGIFPIMEL